MRMLRTLGGLVIAVVVVAVVVISSQPASAANLGTTWQQPITISMGDKRYTDYRTLKSTGDAVYYRLTVTQPTKLLWQINIPRSSSRKFSPQVVLFKPNDVTFGPLLPVIQPPQTIASIYPMTPPRVVFETTTQTIATLRLEAKPYLEAAGTYIFAVYNAGSLSGHYRLVLDRGASSAEWTDVWRLPIHWGQDQLFAGFSWLSLITPIFLALCLWLVYQQLDHHRLHVHKKYPPHKKRNTKK